MALMTPVSGFIQRVNSPIMASNGHWWLIQGRVSIWPSSISWMIRVKSADKALRLASKRHFAAVHERMREA